VTIAVALSFDSGILLCANAQPAVPARIPRQCTNIFSRCYGPRSAGTRSIFARTDASLAATALVHECERALDALEASEFALDRMRHAIQTALNGQAGPSRDPLLAALYSPHDRPVRERPGIRSPAPSPRHYQAADPRAGAPAYMNSVAGGHP
jgi:hypothetical protein